MWTKDKKQKLKCIQQTKEEITYKKEKTKDKNLNFKQKKFKFKRLNGFK